MQYIRKFLEKATIAEKKTKKDLVLSIDEVRGLKDDISNLLADLHEKNKNTSEQEIIVEIKGRSFKDE